METQTIQLEAVIEFSKILQQSLCGGIAICRFFLQQGAKDLRPTRPDSRMNFRDLGQLSGLDLTIEFLTVGAFKKKLSRQQLIKNHSQRKQI